MADKFTFAAGSVGLAACILSIVTLPSAAGTIIGHQPASTHAISKFDLHTYARMAEARKRRKPLGLKQIMGRWCDDKGLRWYFDQEVVIHDKHVHRARYERTASAIIVTVDGYPDRFSEFTQDGLRMTLLSSALDPTLNMRRFSRCLELLSRYQPLD